MKNSLFITAACSLVLASTTPQRASAESGIRNEQLALLDANAGLVVSVELPQLSVAHKLAMELAPQERQALGLAGIGAGVILGFNPFSPQAWSASGFDVSVPMVAQLATADSSDALLRTRIVFKARSAPAVQRTIERMRLADKARPHVKRDSLSPLFTTIARTPNDDELRAQLRAAGVFLVARPRPLAGLLFAQKRGDYVIIDMFDPGGSDFETILRLLGRRPGALDTTIRGAEVLLAGPVGLWLRATQLGSTMERIANNDTKRRKPCRIVASLGRKSSIDTVGIQLSFARKQVNLGATWHVRSTSDLLASFETRQEPLVTGGALLDGQLRVERWDRLRDRKRPIEAQSWDKLWAKTKACGQESRVYALATSWPEIVGLFLSEVSVIHPDAKTAVDSLGAASARFGASVDGTLSIIAEGWVREPGSVIAKGWLKALFGSELEQGTTVVWGKGAIRPYAIDRDGGSVIGAGFRKGSRVLALAAARPAPTQDPQLMVLASVTSSPAKLAKLGPSLPAVSWWRPWKSASASLAAGADKLQLSLSLQR